MIKNEPEPDPTKPLQQQQLKTEPKKQQPFFIHGFSELLLVNIQNRHHQSEKAQQTQHNSPWMGNTRDTRENWRENYP